MAMRTAYGLYGRKAIVVVIRIHDTQCWPVNGPKLQLGTTNFQSALTLLCAVIFKRIMQIPAVYTYVTV